MSLCLKNFDGDSCGHWCGSLLLPLHLVCLVFLCTPSVELGSFISVFPQLVKYVVVSLDSISSPTLGTKILSCLLSLIYFSIRLMVHLSTVHLTFYHVMHGFSFEIKTKTPEVLTQYWQIYSGLCS